MEDVTIDELSYEALETYWLEALDIENGDGYGYGDKQRGNEVGGTDEDYIPGSDVEDDECSEETEEEEEDRNFMTDELNYELAICDVIDNYSIEKNIFTDSELHDLEIKERALIERGDKGYYRNKNVHKMRISKFVKRYNLTYQRKI